jgi:putative DNA primase/helicase
MFITCHSIEVQHHAREFAASAIAPDIAALNFRSWNPLDENDLDYVFDLLIAEPQYRNNGTLAGHAQNELANVIRGGGWIFEGYRGVSVKPDSPRKNSEGKIIKYESPRGTGNQQLFVPRVSVRAGLAIASKLGAVAEEYRRRVELLAPDAADLEFWDWYLERPRFIIITEGAKKACSLVSAGYAAIALNGVWGWGTNEKDMFGAVERDGFGQNLKVLTPELEQFLEDREVVLAFDRDDHPLTVKKVEAAKQRFGQEIEDRVLGVTELKWKGYKGIDDFIASKGVKALDKAYAKRAELAPPIVKCVYFSSSPADGLHKVTNISSEYIGNHLTAIAYLDNPEGTGAAILLEFKTVRNQTRKLSISRSDLAGDGVPILSYLLGCGYYYNRKNKTDILEYLHGLGSDIEQTYTIVDSTGWVNGRYVSQHKTYGDGDYVFQRVEASADAATEIKGTLADWKTHVGAKCDRNSRLIFTLGIAFAAPLLEVTGLESGGFHLMGDTSTGKTTAMKVAVSVTGEKQIPSWRTTTNGLEMTATAHNHSLLPLDEIGQADEKGVGEACYMLRNGQGKSRATKDLRARKVKTWQLLFLSTGEHSLASYMALAGKVQKGGQEVGMPDLPAVPCGSTYGIFESIHGCESSKEFAENLEVACKKYRGTAIDEFLTRLVVDRQDKDFDGATAARVFAVAKKLSEGTIDHAVSRVANRFALVQVALELAHAYDILPFPIDRIDWAVQKMFADWLNQRGGDGSIEIKRAIDNIQHLLTVNEFSDRVYTLPHNDNRPVRNLLAYRKTGIDGYTEELCVPPSIFDREFCNGANKTELIKELQRLGLILAPRADGKPTHKRQIDGKRLNFYIFQKLETEGVQGVQGVREPSNIDVAINSDLEPSVPPEKTMGVQGVRDSIELKNPSVPPVPPEKTTGVRENEQGVRDRESCEPDSEPDLAEERTAVPPVPLRTPAQERDSQQSRSKAEFKAGDRVRYVGGMRKYSGWIGTVTKVVHGSNCAIDWDNGKATESIPVSELSLL